MIPTLLVLALPANAVDCTSTSMNWVDDVSHAVAHSPLGLTHALETILRGQFEEAKSLAHVTANRARMNGNPETAQDAGMIWQVADLLERATQALEDQNAEEAKSLAHQAAELLRELREDGAVGEALASELLNQAGDLWNEAHDLSQTRPHASSIAVPPIDQHALSHHKGGVFCGVVTALMAAQSNGSDLNTSYADIDYIASKMYYSGRGTSGSDMAAFLRSNGMPDAAYTTSGSFTDIHRALQSGQPVPMGVDYTQGTVHSMPNGSSARYGNLGIGSSHSKSFVNPGSGHWVLITGMEGDPNNPSAYIVNDPDTGGTLRVTPSQLSYMSGESDGRFWLIKQN
ncbi:MAG: C39 family peptidase [Myxococcota bacterium]|nr:C39 family peptidase [Myxococcota bacterium]